MKTDAKAIGVAYYTALGEKNIENVKKYLHRDIEFSDPQEKKLVETPSLKQLKGSQEFLKL